MTVHFEAYRPNDNDYYNMVNKLHVNWSYTPGWMWFLDDFGFW